jgi:signal transduction histidine kinase
MWDRLKTKWQSLIFRLLFYFVLSMVAIAIVMATSFTNRIKPHFRNEILPNVEQYIEYLIRDIGIPPDLIVAQQLANDLPFELRIEGPMVNWSSSFELKSIDQHEFRPAPPPYDDVYTGHRHEKHRRSSFLLIEKKEYRYLFAMDNSFREGSERRHWVLFLVLGGILIFLYLAIRRMFRPVQTMSHHVELIGTGDLEHKLEVGGRGELAQLASGINSMSAQIKSMLDSKSGLLLAISHELRSPLTRMRVNLELLDQSEVQQQLIEDIHEMESLVTTILESERLNNKHSVLSLSYCDVSDLIAEVVDVHPWRKRIKTDLLSVKLQVDPLRIKLLLKNLLDNACQYSDEVTDEIEIGLNLTDSKVIIHVQDHGQGIDVEEIPRLTEAFYRPDSSRQRHTGGYGLGLYLCKLIVSAHNGQIVIESEPGKGTRVTVEIPLDNS